MWLSNVNEVFERSSYGETAAPSGRASFADDPAESKSAWLRLSYDLPFDPQRRAAMGPYRVCYAHDTGRNHVFSLLRFLSPGYGFLTGAGPGSPPSRTRVPYNVGSHSRQRTVLFGYSYSKEVHD